MGALIVWLVWRRIRRSGLVGQMVGRGLLHARAAALPPGPHRDLAELRLQLTQNLAHTHRVLVATADTAGGAPAGLAEVAGRLDRAGAGIDAHLRLLEREPDPDLLARSLPRLRDRVDAVAVNAARIRGIALRFTEELDRTDQTQLDNDLQQEIDSLEGGIAALRGL